MLMSPTSVSSIPRCVELSGGKLAIGSNNSWFVNQHMPYETHAEHTSRSSYIKLQHSIYKAQTFSLLQFP